MRLACTSCHALLEAGDARTMRAGAGSCEACWARRPLSSRAMAANGGASRKDPEGGSAEPAASPPSTKATEEPPPSSIDVEVLSMRTEEPPSSIDAEVLSMREVVSVREGAGPSADPGAAAAALKAAAPPLKVNTQASKASTKPAQSEPPPSDDLPPPAVRPKRTAASLPFFQVDLPPLGSDRPPPAAESADEERGPDSGLMDVRKMASLEEKAKNEGRVDADLFNLSGGLFNSPPVGPPLSPLTPPDIHALTGAPEPGRSAGARPPSSARIAPVLAPSPSGPLTERRRLAVDLSAAKRSARAGWIVALVSASVAIVLLALKLGASVGSSEGATPEATAASAAATPRESSAPSATPTPAAAPEAMSTASPAKSSAPASGRADKPGSPATPRAAGGAAAAAPPKGGGAATPPAAAAAPAAPAPAAAAGPEFNVAAARAALAVAAGAASACKRPDDPSGGARVSVTFAPSGRVTSARVNGPPFQGTPTGGCIASAFRSATVPPFGGDPVTVSKEVSVR